MHIYIYIYIYIYSLLTNWLSTSIHGDKEKEKKPPEYRDNKSRITAWGKKEKDYREKKKRKANFVTPVEKNQEVWNQLDIRTKPHRKILQCYNYKKYSILNRANYKNEIANRDYPTTVSTKTAPQGTWSVLGNTRSRFRRNCSRIVPICYFIFIYIHYIYIYIFICYGYY